MAKITVLKQDITFFYEKALEKAENGDFIGCLEYLRLAKKETDYPFCDDDLSISLEIADIYSDMGLYGESNKEYFRLSAFDYCNDEVFYGIIRNFAMLDMPANAAYYLNLGIELGILDSDDGFTPIDMSIFTRQPQLKLVKPQRDAEHTVGVARQLMSGGQTDFARQMLLSVDKNSDGYGETLGLLGFIDLSEGKLEDGLSRLNEALALNPKDVSALSAKIIALNLTGDIKARDEAIDDLKRLDIKSCLDASRAAKCMAECGLGELALYYADIALDDCPYNRDMKLLYAVSLALTGKIAQAKREIVEFNIIYPEDPEGRYFALVINALPIGEPAELPLSCEIPREKKEEYIALIETALENIKGVTAFMNVMEESGELKAAVFWGLRSGIIPLEIKLGTYFARTPLGKMYIRDLFVDPEYPLPVKKAMLVEGFKNYAFQSVQIVINNHLHWFRPSIPKISKSKSHIDAYWLVYGALAFIDSRFDKRLNIWYRKIIKSLQDIKDYKPSAAAIAAVIANKSHINKVFSEVSFACEVFDCPVEDFNALTLRLENERLKAKAKKKKAIT